MRTRDRFPQMPAGSYVCEEGWLIVGEEAWTLHEWLCRLGLRSEEDRSKYRPRGYTEEQRREAHREANRRWRRRQREAAA